MCRICRNSFQSKKRTTTYKVTDKDSKTGITWNELILRVYEYDTKQDSDNVQPTQFCLNCRRAMLGYCQRLEKSQKEGTPKPKRLELATWEEHTDSDCWVCSYFTHGGRKKKACRKNPVAAVQSEPTQPVPDGTAPSTSSQPACTPAKQSGYDHSSYTKDSPRKVFAQAHTSSTKVGTDTLVSRNVGLLLNHLETLKGPRKSPRILKRKRDDGEHQGRPKKFLRMEYDEDTFEDDEDIEILSRYPKYICKNLSALPAIEKELTCKVCDGILDAPVTLNPCEHSVCQCCLDMHLKSFGCICPVCSNFVMSITKAAKVLTRMISNLHVTCINCPNGCDQTMQLGKMWEHFIVCKHHDTGGDKDDERQQQQASSSTEARRSRGRPKGKLLDTTQATANARLQTLKNLVKKHANEKEGGDYDDVVMSLAINMLRSKLKIDVAEKVKALYKGEDKVGLSTRKCLALRVTRFLSLNHYQVLAKTVNAAKGYTDWKPVCQLEDEASKMLPGGVEFKLEPPSDALPVNAKEPLDVLCGFPQDKASKPPAIQGSRWPLSSAVAAGLADIANTTNQDMDQCPHKSVGHELAVLIKFGDDGMGDVRVKKGTNSELTDKCFKWSFVVDKITYKCNGKDYTFFQEPNPGSEFCCHPVLLARAEETDPDIPYITRPIFEEMEILSSEGRTMEVGGRRYSLKFIGTMYDEKRVRIIQGFGAAGSDNLCTLCDCGRTEAKDLEAHHAVTRTYEVTLARYNERKYNMEAKSTAQIYKDLLGQTGKPQAKLHPTIDATHMTINMGGSVFKPIYIHEAANSKTRLTGAALKKATKSLSKFFKQRIGLQTPLMADGNYARRLVEDRTVIALCQRIKDDDRKEAVKELVQLYRQMQPVWSCSDPCGTYPGLVEQYEENAKAFCKLLREKFTYFTTWPNYLHKMTAHVKEIIMRDKTIGRLSSGAHEKSNKLTRYELRHRSRQISEHEWRDVLKIQSLYTCRQLQQEMKHRVRNIYTCSICHVPGHTKKKHKVREEPNE